MAEKGQGQGEQVIFVAPPTGGLNTFENPLSLSPQFASEYVNFMPPTGSGIVARPAIEEVLKFDGLGLALLSYTSSATTVPLPTSYFDVAQTYPEISNLMIKMRLPDGTNVLYETTPQSTPPSYKVIDQIVSDSNNNDYILFLDALYICDGGYSRPYIYVKGRKLVHMRWFAPVAKPDAPEDAGRWFVGDQITGVENLVIYKNRMMGSQRNTLNIFYIPAVDANPLDPAHYDPSDVNKAYIVETTGVFTLLGVVSKGGSILKMFTVASGKQGELSDLFCVLTTKGELVVYEGSDPSQLKTWSLLGHYYIAIPLNKNCICNVEGDVIIATINGFVSVKAILAGGQSQGALSEALEKRISTLFSQFQFKVPTFIDFMFLQFHNKRKLLVFNVPERMSIPLAKVEAGYVFDNNTWLILFNDLENPEFNEVVVGTLKHYMWYFSRDFTLTYYLNNSAESRIELHFSSYNIVGGGSPYTVSCETTATFRIYTQNPDTYETTFISLFDRDPIYRCPNILQEPENMIAETIIKPRWNSEFAQGEISVADKSVTPIVCRIPPPRPTDKLYSWQVTDVNCSSSSFLEGQFSNLINIMSLLPAVDLFKSGQYTMGYSSDTWVNPTVSAPSVLDLRRGANMVNGVVNVTDLPISAADLTAWTVGMSKDRWNFIVDTWQGQKTLLSVYTNMPSIITAESTSGLLLPTVMYFKQRVGVSNEWNDLTPPKNASVLVKDTDNPDYFIRYNRMGKDGPGAIEYHDGLRQLLDRMLIQSNKFYNPATSFTQHLQYNFFPCFLEEGNVQYQTSPAGPWFTKVITDAMPHGTFYGAASLISKIIANVRAAFEIVSPDEAPTPSLYATILLHNALRITNAQSTTLLDLPIDLRTIVKWNYYTTGGGDSKVHGVYELSFDFVLYMGTYTLAADPPLSPTVEYYTTFVTSRPWYCCTYHTAFMRDGDSTSNQHAYDFQPSGSAPVFRLIRNVPWQVADLSDTSLTQCETSIVLENSSASLNVGYVLTRLTRGIYVGNWFTQTKSWRSVWANQLGWMYSIVTFRDDRGKAFAGKNDNTDVNREACPFVNFITTQQSYKSSQYVLDVQRGTWAQWKDINMITGIEHENEFYFIRNVEGNETLEQVMFTPMQTQLCRFNSDLDGDFGTNAIDAYYKTGFTDLGAPNLKKFTKCKIFGTASVFWGRYPYDLYYSIDFQDQDPVRYSGDTVARELRKPEILRVKPKMLMKSQLNNVSYSEYAAKAKYLQDYLTASNNVKWVNMMTIAAQGTRIAIGSRFSITEHNVIVWGYEVHFIPLSSY